MKPKRSVTIQEGQERLSRTDPRYYQSNQPNLSNRLDKTAQEELIEGVSVNTVSGEFSFKLEKVKSGLTRKQRKAIGRRRFQDRKLAERAWSERQVQAAGFTLPDPDSEFGD